MGNDIVFGVSVDFGDCFTTAFVAAKLQERGWVVCVKPIVVGFCRDIWISHVSVDDFHGSARLILVVPNNSHSVASFSGVPVFQNDILIRGSIGVQNQQLCCSSKHETFTVKKCGGRLNRVYQSLIGWSVDDQIAPEEFDCWSSGGSGTRIDGDLRVRTVRTRNHVLVEQYFIVGGRKNASVGCRKTYDVCSRN